MLNIRLWLGTSKHSIIGDPMYNLDRRVLSGHPSLLSKRVEKNLYDDFCAEASRKGFCTSDHRQVVLTELPGICSRAAGCVCGGGGGFMHCQHGTGPGDDLQRFEGGRASGLRIRACFCFKGGAPTSPPLLKGTEESSHVVQDGTALYARHF